MAVNLDRREPGQRLFRRLGDPVVGQQFPPSQYVCGYSPNLFYISNFYNGTESERPSTANGVPLNPYFKQPFVPSYGDDNSFNYPLPLNLYLQSR